MADYFETEEYESQGSLRAAAHFSAEADSEALRKAFKGIGTNEEEVLAVLGNRSVDQRLAIALQYKTMFGRDLHDDLKSELDGNFYKVCNLLCLRPAAVDATYIHGAIKGAGTNETHLIEVLCTRTNEQIRRIKLVYKELFGEELEAAVVSDTSGFLKAILVALLQANRDESRTVDPALVQQDAQRLFEAGEGQLGTDEERFIAVLVARSPTHIRAVLHAYKLLSEKTLEQVIESELSGTLAEAALAIVRSIENKPAFFARLLYTAMKGAGTKDESLIHTIVSRCEVDMQQIKVEFFRLSEQPLAKYVAEDVNGDYRRILLALLGAQADGSE
jgi:hypothetical protein